MTLKNILKIGGVAAFSCYIMSMKDGKNKAVWGGTVVSPLTYSHETTSKEDGTVEKYYRFNIEVETTTNKGLVLDKSVLPMLVNEKKLEALEKELNVGDVVFVRGSWRAYPVADEETQKRRVEQVGYVKVISHTELGGKSLNRFEFEGVLKSKLFEPLRENGKPVRTKTGALVPLLNENKEKIWTVRLNKEKKIVNDYQICISYNDRLFFIPALSYYRLAQKVANEINIDDEISGSGYIRSREIEQNGDTKVVYEAVIVSIDKIKETTETE